MNKRVRVIKDSDKGKSHVNSGKTSYYDFMCLPTLHRNTGQGILDKTL